MGYLQTTWLLNYKDAKAGGCNKDASGGTVDIVDDPGKVATDDTLAWCTTAYFWKKKSTTIVAAPHATLALPFMPSMPIKSAKEEQSSLRPTGRKRRIVGATMPPSTEATRTSGRMM